MGLVKRSYLSLLLLCLLEEGESYGYQLAQAIKKRSKGEWGPKEATLYPLLRELEKSGIIQGAWRQSDEGPPRKYFRLTSKGRKYLGEEMKTLHAFMEMFSPAVEKGR